jgi:carboxymethylenebutenolidase
MSQYETLMARDGHVFGAYIAKPPGAARGGVVIVQEIFGLTEHIRAVADSYAQAGYLAVAPALFDRVRRGIVLGHSPEDAQHGMGYRKEIGDAPAVLDIIASVAVVGHAGRVAVIGYCWGGRLAWLTARQIPLNAAVCYYGSGIGGLLDKTPMCPTMLHFGAEDRSIPMSEIEHIRAAYPQGKIHVYPGAGHAFNNNDRPDHYDEPSAQLARTRTNEFLAQQLG